MLPVVAIIGKPNVGKSTLFNRLLGYRKAIVSPVPGTTRDRHYAEIPDRRPYLLVDTGGLASKTEGSLETSIQSQARLAIEEASLILFLVSTKEGLTREDYAVANLLRKSGKTIILLAGKCDSCTESLEDFFNLGFRDPLAISSIHNKGIEELRTLIQQSIPKIKKDLKKGDAIRIAIVGRPNVGKSSLINKLLGEEKVIVSEKPGTTVDSTDTEIIVGDDRFILVDTAGVRKRGKIKKGIEHYSFLRSLQACRAADVSILLMDSEEGLTAQDQHIAEYILESHSGLILAINKIDVLEKGEEGEEQKGELYHVLQHKFAFAKFAPVIFLSAYSGENIEHLFALAKKIHERRSLRISTSILNRFLEKVIVDHAPVRKGSHTPKFFYLTQVEVKPPHFVLFVNDPEFVHHSYLRHIENKLREHFDFFGTAIKIDLKKR